MRKLLTVKLGPVPEDALQVITTASEAQLDLWIERVLTAPSLAAVLAD